MCSDHQAERLLFCGLITNTYLLIAMTTTELMLPDGAISEASQSDDDYAASTGMRSDLAAVAQGLQ